VSIINTRNVPKPKLPTNAANSQTQPLVYSDPGPGLTYGGGSMSSTRSQVALSGVSNVNVNKNKVWYTNVAGRPVSVCFLFGLPIGRFRQNCLRPRPLPLTPLSPLLPPPLSFQNSLKYPATRARTSLSGPLDFGGSRDS
jgi:hypothetical protein